MQRVKPMICISQSAESYKHKKHSRRVADDDARLFVSMIERGLSLDAVIEIMTGVSNTHVDSVIDARARQACIAKLIKSHIVRESGLFCALLGVNRIMLAEFNKERFDTIKDAGMWLQLHGYTQLPRKQYTDCIQAWCKSQSVAKIQELPSGKFLVQEFKIV